MRFLYTLSLSGKFRTPRKMSTFVNKPEFQRQLPHGEIAPRPLASDIVNLPAALAANPTAQEPLTQPVDMHQHELVGLFYPGHSMGLQTQLFSDKGLYEHLGSVLSYSLAGNTKLNRYGVPFKSPSGRRSKHSNSFKCNYTLRRGAELYWGRSNKLR